MRRDLEVLSCTPLKRGDLSTLQEFFNGLAHQFRRRLPSALCFALQGLLTPGRVLELGCEHGRNALFLTDLGCSVDAVDFSAEAIQWAMERAKAAELPVSLQCSSIFNAEITESSEDRLRALWDVEDFSVQVLRKMTKMNNQGPSFGEDFLWTLLATKKSSF